MITYKETIDINAHIENLECEVIVEEKTPVALISFDNLSYGDIVAIKFNAKGYNSFDEVVPVEGKDDFTLLIQDLEVCKKEYSGIVKVDLPDNTIRKVVLEEKQICFSDGSIVEYAGKRERELEYEEFNTEDIAENRQMLSLSEEFNTNFKYKPKDFQSGWLCGCGGINGTENKVCTSCDAEKDRVFSVFETEKLNEVVQKYKVKERNRMLKGFFIVAVVIGAIIGITALVMHMIDQAEIAKRVTYNSEAEMREAVQGVWVCYYESTGDPMWAIEIKGDELSRYNYSDDKDVYTRTIKYNPERGSLFEDEYIIKPDGDGIAIVEGNYTYKPGIIESLNRDPSTPEYKADMEKAKECAEEYAERLESSRADIYSVSVSAGDGTCRGNRYEFYCSVFHGSIWRSGTITVYKEDNGSFSVGSLMFDN